MTTQIFNTVKNLWHKQTNKKHTKKSEDQREDPQQKERTNY